MHSSAMKSGPVILWSNGDVELSSRYSSPAVNSEGEGAEGRGGGERISADTPSQARNCCDKNRGNASTHCSSHTCCPAEDAYAIVEGCFAKEKVLRKQ